MISLLLPLVLAVAPVPADLGAEVLSAPPARSHEDAKLWLSAGLGPSFYTSGGSPGLLGSARLGIDLAALDPKTTVALVLPLNVGWANAGIGVGYVSIWALEFLPSARFSFKVSPQLYLYGDLGLGFVFNQYTASISNYMGYSATVGASAAGLGFRIAAGLAFALSDRLFLNLEPLGWVTSTAAAYSYNGVNYSLGLGSQFGLFFGVTYRI